MTEMDFRQYDAAIGRFTGIDKLSEEFFSMTPYNFAGNNPISYIDPSGLKLIAPTDSPYVPAVQLETCQVVMATTGTAI